MDIKLITYSSILKCKSRFIYDEKGSCRYGGNGNRVKIKWVQVG